MAIIPRASDSILWIESVHLASLCITNTCTKTILQSYHNSIAAGNQALKAMAHAAHFSFQQAFCCADPASKRLSAPPGHRQAGRQVLDWTSAIATARRVLSSWRAANLRTEGVMRMREMARRTRLRRGVLSPLMMMTSQLWLTIVAAGHIS